MQKKPKQLFKNLGFLQPCSKLSSRPLTHIMLRSSPPPPPKKLTGSGQFPNMALVGAGGPDP